MGVFLAFALPILISIPVGIVTNILTPRMQKFLGRFNSRIRLRNQRRRVAEELLVRWLAKNPQAFAYYMQTEGIKVLFGLGVMIFNAIILIYIVTSPPTPVQANGYMGAYRIAFMILVQLGMMVTVVGISTIDQKRIRRGKAVAKVNGWYTWRKKVWSAEANKFVDLLDHPSHSALRNRLINARSVDLESLDPGREHPTASN